jgi:hypothetical protein|tara:strand:+ start:262 stop:411 length:150 start_codon:yes stop_codon:yes gene_type:complete
MNNIIEKVLKEYAHMEVNLASESARQIIAKRIEEALLVEINVRLASQEK